MTEFYHKTTPKYYLLKCKLEVRKWSAPNSAKLFKQVDCNRLWKSRWTVMGSCIELDVDKQSLKLILNAYRVNLVFNLWKAIEIQQQRAELEQKAFAGRFGENFENQEFEDEQVQSQINRIKKVRMTLGFNQSDGTFGWNQYRDGLTMYYLHPKEHYIQDGSEVVTIVSEHLVLIREPHRTARTLFSTSSRANPTDQCRVCENVTLRHSFPSALI